MYGTVVVPMSVVNLKVNSITRQRLLHRLGYELRDEALFDRARTHRSCGATHNERL